MVRVAMISLPLAILLSGCEKGAQESAPAAIRTSAPSETEPANAPTQKPAVPGQTRAPTMRADVKFVVQEIATGLDYPWSMEFLPDGKMIVAEKSGAFRFVSADGKISPAGKGLPAVDPEGQGGLLDVALDPKFAQNRIIYWTYAEPREGGNGTALARGRLASGGRPDVTDVKVLFRMMPTLDSKMHYGSRIAFAPDGKIFLSLGERSIPEGRKQSQDLGSHFGKTIRINADGSVPQDNPFVGRPGARPEIWTIGHRNMQGIGIHPNTGQVWTIEHGPRGGDELNRLDKGRNYGWPTITYGIEYKGEPVGEGLTQREGMEQPIYYWDPVIAPSSLLFYTGNMFPAWKGSVFLSGLASMKLVRLTMNGEKVAGEEWLLADRAERYREVKQGPEGALYLITDEGSIIKVSAAK